MAGATADQAAEGKTALAKASWRILPLIGLAYGAAYMDRINISFAAKQMNLDLHFSASVYGLGGGLFFLSYAVLEVPSNLLLVRFGARRWIARIMLTWGVIAAGMMLVRTPLQFYVMRFLLGAAEAGFFPGVIYYLTQWFPAAVRGRAISRFYVAYPLSTIVMGAAAGPLLSLGGDLGLRGWQWLFLLEGLPALVLGWAVLAWLPDTPQTAPWLAPAERTWLCATLQADLTASDRQAYAGLARALANPFVLTFTLVNFIVLGSGYALNLSAPLLLGLATGLGSSAVGLLVAVGGGLGAAGMLFIGWSSDRRGERYLHLAAPILLMALGAAVLALAFPGWPLGFVAGYWIVAACGPAVMAAFWLAPGEVLSQRAMAVSVAAINSLGQLGSFALPALFGFLRDATGGYQLGLAALPVLYAAAAVCVLLARRRRSLALTTQAA